MSERRSVLFLIDVEPDARKTRDGPGGWEGSDAAIEHVERLRGQLEEATAAPVQLNWFLRVDPQIEHTWGRADWVAEACPRIIRTIQDRGDYSGIHPHMWRWHAQRQEWFNDLTDRAWTSECLHTAVAGYERIFGRPPEASRFGDRWLDQHTVELLRELGVRYDLTIEPGMPDTPIHDDRQATGRLPDYRGAPRNPYVPSRENFLVPTTISADSTSLWLLPLTTTLPSWRLIRRPPYLMKASRPPNLALSSSYVWPHIRKQLEEGGDVSAIDRIAERRSDQSHLSEEFSANNGRAGETPDAGWLRVHQPPYCCCAMANERTTQGDSETVNGGPHYSMLPAALTVSLPPCVVFFSQPFGMFGFPLISLVGNGQHVIASL